MSKPKLTTQGKTPALESETATIASESSSAASTLSGSSSERSSVVSHSGGYICSQCERKFISLSHISIHMQKHIVQRQLPYRCSDCSETFASGKAMSNHRREAHHSKKGIPMHMKHRKSLGDIRSKLGGSGQRAGMCPNCNQVTPAGGKRKSSDLRERQAPSVSASVTEFCYDKPGMTMPGRSRQYLFLTAIYTFWVYAVFNL